MPNIKSNTKRVKTNEKSALSNKRQKSQLKNTLKNFTVAVENQDKEKATELFRNANTLLDKSMTSNIHHKNYVSRKKSHISQLYNTLD
ncbi:30S ribosomal protein S20 [Erysipelothrix inopinata]|uniref:Small ribosomal subunit protein bS20 n=1 Tax=Erysipelothrix inopinata TaxID=225084 RepID=A0A7G9RYG4_9FIRM|nr:30S ribosomal protein S20 [Erysipelothrix inopinata]QNN60639.1 30S ribosomal protein S20 [Erysipelothrix inopinata]